MMARLITGWLVACCAVTPIAAQAPDLAMLRTLEPGAWTLRLRDGGSAQRICVRTGREFIQLRHRQPSCERFVVRDGPREVTVQYTCRGNGYGRTTIRRESDTLVQIRSQGIEGGAPFSIDGEARRTGGC
ncbi:hypothetical protein GRI62_13055 [Erythrobacter arachoides]|uniref:DUF3617 family protein n=1 Tax=Aurantiacibacter arachoides TaxID=1850444 RepID=A0A845A5U8_9SPHN|nr:hypothetical protein [Aurantiacibacter arachoides]MXO94526.1 hypothetical protein [Aurantiacibacter arachoides]